MPSPNSAERRNNGREIKEGDYIVVNETGEIYCDEDQLLADLEEQEYFTWHLIEDNQCQQIFYLERYVYVGLF